MGQLALRPVVLARIHVQLVDTRQHTSIVLGAAMEMPSTWSLDSKNMLGFAWA